MNQLAMTGRSTKSFEAESTLVVAVAMSRSVWLVAGLLAGIDRRPLKKMTSDEKELTVIAGAWCGDVAATRRSNRRVVGRARWLPARPIAAETGLRVQGHPRQQF
jgi:transposase